MDVGLRTPLVEAFRRADVPKDLKLDAAAGLVAPRALEQLALFAMLVDDADADVRGKAERTLSLIAPAAIAAVLARADAPADLIRFFDARGIVAAAGPPDADTDAPLVETPLEVVEPSAGAGGGPADTMSMTQQIQNMGIVDRVRVAMKGSREARAMLIRDPNRMVAAAVLSSPKLTMAEVESFAKMANVSDDTLRAIAQNRAWVKNYGIAHGLVKNPRTPVAMSLNLMQRLVDRDVRALAVDRNVPEPLRLAARKRMVKATS